MKEIERKYLVQQNDFSFLNSVEGKKIKQAYIQNEEDRTVRIRTKADKAFLTIKIGKDTLSRDEFEYQIPVKDALSMMEIMNLKVLSKTRYEIKFENNLWEVDVFEGKLDGLIIAEIELESEDESFNKPVWLGREVTNEPSYLNAKLIEKL
jgi:CYTH domain-containing protein